MKSWTIKKRIVAGYTVIVTLSAIMGILAWISMRAIGGHADELAGDYVPGLSMSADLLQNFSDAHLALIRHILATNPEEKQALEAKIKELGEVNTKLIGDLEKICNLPEEKNLMEKLAQAGQDYIAARASILQLSDAGKKDEAIALLMNSGFATHDAYNKHGMEFSDYEARVAADGAATIQQKVKSSKIMLNSVVLGELAISIFLGFLVVTGLNRVLRKVSSSLGEGAEQVASAASQVSGSSQSLADGASEQAASLEETSSSLEEMASMTKRNAENAWNANDLAKQARTAADKGVGDMQAMSAAMEAIKVSSDDIAKIIKTIDEIAFQTNILALNAAVEAARAGEAGMGFAVVADEVRNLAQRSAQAAKETAAKIEGAIAKTGQGVEISRKVGETLNEIVTKARQVDELVAEVASASREQTQGITQVNTAVGQMDKVTQSDAANAEESAAAAEELNAQASVMKESVGELLKLVGGSNVADSFSAPAEAPATPAASPSSNGRSGARKSIHHVQSFEPRPATPPIPMPGDRGVRGQKSLIAWDPAQMSTGVDTIDNQHQELIDRINQLHAACVAGTAREELVKMLGFLGEYAQSHFRHEEELMQNHRCPARGQNKAAHVQFLRDYETLAEIIKRDGPTTTAVLQIKDLLGNWLKNHICAIDTKLRACAGNGSSACKKAAVSDRDFQDF